VKAADALATAEKRRNQATKKLGPGGLSIHFQSQPSLIRAGHIGGGRAAKHSSSLRYAARTDLRHAGHSPKASPPTRKNTVQRSCSLAIKISYGRRSKQRRKPLPINCATPGSPLPPSTTWIGAATGRRSRWRPRTW
jgi:hypothetical protein